jgi:hypothetical protein
MKVSSLHLANEPHQAQLIIVAEGGEKYTFKPNDDQLMLLLHQITHVIWSSCRQIRRDKVHTELEHGWNDE